LRIYASACSKQQKESDTKNIRISQESRDVSSRVNRGTNHLSGKDENSIPDRNYQMIRAVPLAKLQKIWVVT